MTNSHDFGDFLKSITYEGSHKATHQFASIQNQAHVLKYVKNAKFTLKYWLNPEIKITKFDWIFRIVSLLGYRM